LNGERKETARKEKRDKKFGGSSGPSRRSREGNRTYFERKVKTGQRRDITVNNFRVDLKFRIPSVSIEQI